MKITLSTTKYSNFPDLKVGDVFQSDTFSSKVFIKTLDILESNGLVGTKRNAFCLNDSALYTFGSGSDVVLKDAELIVK